ncbi:MAG: RNA polymerase sigma factor [Pseudomonadota bacterium]
MQTATPTLEACDATASQAFLLQTGERPVRRTNTEDNETLFRRLFKDYGTSLHYFIFKRVGHHDEAAELTQQAFVEAACSLSNWRGESEISTWLFGIATNLARNHMSRAPRRRYQFVSDTVLDEQESPFADPRLQASQNQTLSVADEALAKLPPDMSKALCLVAIDGLSYEETAAQLGIPVGTVRSRVSRARAAVREHFESRGITSCG